MRKVFISIVERRTGCECRISRGRRPKDYFIGTLADLCKVTMEINTGDCTRPREKQEIADAIANHTELDFLAYNSYSEITPYRK